MPQFIVDIPATDGFVFKKKHLTELAQAIQSDLEEVLEVTGLCEDCESSNHLGFKVTVTPVIG